MNEIATWNLLANVVSTLFMVGVIWFVQIVHYPLFQQVGKLEFGKYERNHQRLTGYVVAPVMICELATSLLMLIWRPNSVPISLGWLSIGCLIAIWSLTYAVQVPQHQRLTEGYDQELAKRLAAGNWRRTWCWTLRGGLVMWMIWLIVK